MATYYVRNDGNNSNTGTGPATNQAWQTIAYAFANMTLTISTAIEINISYIISYAVITILAFVNIYPFLKFCTAIDAYVHFIFHISVFFRS